MRKDLEKKLEELDVFKNITKIEEGLEFFVVGGCIRDMAMGLVPNDVDVMVVGSSEEELIKRGFNRVGVDFPVFLHPITKDEWALARKEHSIGHGTNDFSVKTEGVSLVDDLYRRDITINAMAYSPGLGLVDPYNGLEDIKNGVLRHVSKAFNEDPLRSLRVARFSARYPSFKIQKDTLEIMRLQKEGLKIMAKERIWKEFEKCLSYKKPTNYFRVLKDLDLLEIVHPMIFKMIGVEQPIIHHAEGDVFEHTMRVLDQVVDMTNNIKIRYAAIYHDIGKAEAFIQNGNLHEHYSYEIVTKELECLKEQKHPKAFIRLAKVCAINHHFIHGFSKLKPGTICKRFLKISREKTIDGISVKTPQIFPENEFEMDALMIVSSGDESGRLMATDNNQKPLSLEEVDKIFEVNDEGFYIETVHLKKIDNREKISVLSKMFSDFLLTKIIYPEDFLSLPAKEKQKAYSEFKHRHTIDLIRKNLRECKCKC